MKRKVRLIIASFAMTASVLCLSVMFAATSMVDSKSGPRPMRDPNDHRDYCREFYQQCRSGCKTDYERMLGVSDVNEYPGGAYGAASNFYRDCMKRCDEGYARCQKND
jgi:hypothetical protein